MSSFIAFLINYLKPAYFSPFPISFLRKRSFPPPQPRPVAQSNAGIAFQCPQKIKKTPEETGAFIS